MSAPAQPTDEQEIELLDVETGTGRTPAGLEATVVTRHRTRQVTRGTLPHRLHQWGGPMVVAVAVIGAAFTLPVLEGRLLTRVVALAVILWGLDVQLGLGGQLSLGHGAFAGAGAYTAALTAGVHGWPYPLALAAAAVVGLVAGGLVGLPSLRIRGQYLAMVTLGTAVAFPYVIRALGRYTGGSNGPPIDYRWLPPSWLGLETRHYHRWTHLVVVTVAVAVFFTVRAIILGSLGRRIRAVADDPVAAAAYGIRVGPVRVVTVALSAAVAGVGGALLVFQSLAVTADSFDLFFSLSLYAAAVFGGIGTLTGSIYGAVLLVLAPWLVSKLGLRVESEMIAGIVLLVFAMFAPQGLSGLLKPLTTQWLHIREPEEVARATSSGSVRN